MKITDIYATTFPALRIDSAAVADVDRPRLIRRMKSPARRTGFREANIIPYQHAPFDMRWVHVDPASYPLQSERRSYLEHAAAGTEWIALPTAAAPFFSRAVVAGDARMIAAQVINHEWSEPLRRSVITRAPNITREARHYLLRHGWGEEDLFHHVVAWLAATRDAHRIPLPDDRGRLRISALLGYRVARLFSADESLITRPQEPELRAIGAPTRVGKEARMLRGSVLLIDDLWQDAERVVARPYADDELLALGDYADATGTGVSELLEILGEQTCDVHLNEKAYWKNVPLAVWRRGELRDWIRARHASALERPLSRDEAVHFSNAARRIASLLLLAPALAQNAELVGATVSAGVG
ncbi:MAG TPA: hypothetical protein VJ276_08595 [Thermoanaerobaculia bacterium]|nr:hypothetical protein [Thermoanaerobaculia bacterium]